MACAPAADVVIPPVTTAPVPVWVSPRFDYPPARRSDDVDEMHDTRVPDPYRWLEADSEETRTWFEAQDQRARRVIATIPGTKELIAALRPLYANPLPRLAAEHPASKGATRWIPSRDGAHAIAEQSKNGLDKRSAVVVETKSGRELERMAGFEGSEVAWTKGGFFYGYAPPEAPHASRFGQRSIRYHAVGTEQTQDLVVVPPSNDENASSAMNPIAVTKDGARLLVQTSGNWTSSTFAVVDLKKAEWRAVQIARADAAIVVENAIYVWAGEIGRIEGTSPIPKTVMPAPPKTLDLDSIGPYAVVKRAARNDELSDGFVHRDFYDASFKKLSTLDTPRGMTDSLFWPGPDATKVIVTRQGLGSPARRFELDPRTGARTELGASNPDWAKDDFRIDTLEARSRDGTRIPITVLRRRDTPVDGTAALALYGYGGFRNSAEQIFYPGWMIWPRERGRVFAQCHMRGGVEFGLDWHRAGAVRNRQNAIDDFHACLEALHEARYSTPGRTVTQGWSHGGMMVTAAAMQRPDLQRVVIAQAPLEDMIRYVHFGRGGISEYGDPNDKGDFEALIEFSPYHNVNGGMPYPAFFVTSPSADERVHPMHPRKIVAALQHASSGGEVLLKVLWDAGHHGGAKDDANEVMAEAWAFALSKMDRVVPDRGDGGRRAQGGEDQSGF